ncbi:NACHT and WD domain protein [Xylaria palmicola]|nr:NACHT and WD domain protein [Xylaria palmicola]
MTDQPAPPKALSHSESSLLRPSDTSTAYESKSNQGTIEEPGSDRKRAGSFLRRRLPLGRPSKHQGAVPVGPGDPFGLRLLHEASPPLINIVFVHGLRGGSSKTWRKGDDPRLFWPQYWLPIEPDLSDASIFTFGYDSDWGSFNPSVLNVHDFGQALYQELRSSPYLRKTPDLPIIMIGHSMGGLVIKKAYILAHQDQAHHQLAERIRSIFFLATPHKGSELAPVLNRILKISGVSPREYINELYQGSISAQLINDDFRRFATSLHIYSFYETLATNLGFSFSLIVDKDSAVLGLNNEIARYMNANHRGICKFDGPEDPNYITLKNSLTLEVQELLREARALHKETPKAQLQLLQNFLRITGPPDECHDRLGGSCQWINERDDFKEWRDSHDGWDDCQKPQSAPSIYCVLANPGAGKTTLAAHVASHLVQFQLPRAFYHFHVGKKSQESLSGCLRSIALQMAIANSAIRTGLSGLIEERVDVDPDDAQAVWQRVFRAVVFQTPNVPTQYWVLDAIDECLGYTDLFTFLKGVKFSFPLKIFITSRKLPDLPKLAHQIHNHAVHIVEIPIADTMRDIRFYIRDRMGVLPIDKEEDREKLSEEILSKSNGSFIWVRLVLDQLDSLYGYESIWSVLQGIPGGMVPYYQRILGEMGKNEREKHISRAILIWTAYASRPLTVLELAEAIRIDINVYLPSAITAIEGLCGQLVSVDKHTGFVTIVHTTAREFLLSHEAGDFRISRSEANDRLALVCLQLLVSSAMQPPRHKRLVTQKRREQPDSPLLDYAITQFSEHILGSSAENDKILTEMNRFLYATVLTWIEKVAAGGGLRYVHQVAKNFKAYLDRRAKNNSPSNQTASTIASWAGDLGRLVTKFGGLLMVQPKSIYFLIPPLCPTETAIYKQFGQAANGLILSGFVSRNWDDCVATLSFEASTPTSVTSNDRHIAVGFDQGHIQLYNHDSYQKYHEMGRKYPIEHLAFCPSGAFIVSAGPEYIAVWDLDGSMLWENHISSRCILLTASSSFVICVMMSAEATLWDIVTGEQLEHRHYPYQDTDLLDQLPKMSSKAPFIGSFSPGLELLALAYWPGLICIFELQNHQWLTQAVNKTSGHVTHLAFNPNPDINLLLVAYDDANLYLYEPWSGAVVDSKKPETDACFQSLCCSPDGRTFGTVDTQGNLRIWDFESLTIIYHVLTPANWSRKLYFTSDGFSLLDMSHQEMRIWAASALIRTTAGEECDSLKTKDAILPVDAGRYREFCSSELRVISHFGKHPFFLAGNYEGDIMIYRQDGDLAGVLYSHPNAFIRCIASSKSDIVATADINCGIQVWKLDTSPQRVPRAANQEFQTLFEFPVRQMLFDDEGRYLLVSTMESEHVYEVGTGKEVGSLSFPYGEREKWWWTYIPTCTGTGRFVLISDGKVTWYSPATFPSEPEGDIELEIEVDSGFAIHAIESIAINLETSSLILDVSQTCGFLTSSILLIFHIPELFDPSHTTRRVQPVRTFSSNYCAQFLGIDQAHCKLLFLHKTSWVCSIKLTALADKVYTRHFFVPSEFTTRIRDIPPLFTEGKAFIFALHDKFAVIRNGLGFQEAVTHDGD